MQLHEPLYTAPLIVAEQMSPLLLLEVQLPVPLPPEVLHVQLRLYPQLPTEEGSQALVVPWHS